MKGKLDTVYMASLFLDNMSVMSFVVEPGTIHVTMANDKRTAIGTPLNDALYAFIDQRVDLINRMNSLRRKEAQLIMDGTSADAAEAHTAEEENRLSTEMDNLVHHFLRVNYENLLGPEVFLMLCSSLPYPMLTQEVESWLKDAPYVFKQNPRVSGFIKAARENQTRMEEERRMQQNASPYR
jgi:hypothetical protein